MLTASVSHEVENNFYSRCEPERRPRFIQDRLESASRSSPHTFTQEEIDSERGTSRADTKKSPKYDSSLFIALYKTFATRIWFAGFLKIFSGAFLKSFLIWLTRFSCLDTLRTTTPLVTKVFLEWLVESYVYYRLDDEERAAGVVPKPRGIGYGIGFAVALFTMQGMSLRSSITTILISRPHRSSWFGTACLFPIRSWLNRVTDEHSSLSG